MKTILSRRHFLKKTSAGLAGAAAGSISLYGIACTQQTTREKSSLSKFSCEFGVEGSAPESQSHLTFF